MHTTVEAQHAQHHRLRQAGSFLSGCGADVGGNALQASSRGMQPRTGGAGGWALLAFGRFRNSDVPTVVVVHVSTVLLLLERSLLCCWAMESQ
jgi:hypothetical protein